MQSPTPSSQRITHPQPAISAGTRQLSVAVFFAMLVLFLVVMPFLQELRNGDLIQNGLLTLVMASGVLVLGASRKTLALALVLAVPAVVGKWLNHYWPEAMPATVFLTAGVLFFVFMIAHLLRFTLRARRVSLEVLWAGMATYLVLGLLWAIGYLLVARLIPEAFDFSGKQPPGHLIDSFEAVYFSFVTLCTMGYGDIVPVMRVPRMMAMLEATTGVFFISVFISRLVALYTAEAALEGGRDNREASSRPSGES